MAITVTEALVKIREEGTKQTTDALKELGSAFTSLPGLAAIGGGAVVAGAVAIGAASVKMAGDFQSGITSLVTGAGMSQNAVGMVSQAILKMAVDTGTSTKQLTDGMFMISSAGYPAAQALDILKKSAEGAKVGNADLGVVADATTTIMKDYPGVMNGAAGAVNTLIATVASGKTHMQDLSQSLAMVLPTAAAARVGLYDVMGAMATMTGEGVPAANAATYLRQTILALDAPSAAATKTLKDIGLTTADVSDMMQQSLPLALQTITEHLAKKFPEGSAQYVEAIKAISGGSKTMQGILDLTGDHMKDFIKNGNDVGGVAVASGSKIQGWGLVQDDFNFKVDRAKAVVETLMISIGTKLLPVVGQAVDFFSANLVPALTAVMQAGENVIATTQRLIVWFQSVGTSISSAWNVAYTGVQTATSAIQAAITTVMNVVNGVITTAQNFWNQWGGVIGIVAGALTVVFLPALIATGVQAITTGATIASNFIVSLIAAGVQAGVASAVGMANFLVSLVTTGLRAAETAAVVVGTLVPAIVAQGIAMAAAAAGGIAAAITGLIGYAAAGWAAAAATIAATWPILAIIVAVGALVAVVILIITHWGTLSKNFADSGFGKVVLAIFDDIVKQVEKLISRIGDFLGVLGKVKDFAGGALGGIGSALDKIPHFAAGGISPGGLSLVGEQGPEYAVFPQGTRIIPAAQTRQIQQAPLYGGQGSSGQVFNIYGSDMESAKRIADEVSYQQRRRALLTSTTGGY